MKERQINFCIEKIQEMLQLINSEKKWTIKYFYPKDFHEFEPYSPWDVQRHHLFVNDEYFLIMDDDGILYAVNVTGDSVLTAVEELMLLLSKKF